MTNTPNGFGIHTWGDVVAILSILVMAIGGIQWGLKIESKLESALALHISDDRSVQDRISHLEQELIDCRKNLGSGVDNIRSPR